MRVAMMAFLRRQLRRLARPYAVAVCVGGVLSVGGGVGESHSSELRLAQQEVEAGAAPDQAPDAPTGGDAAASEQSPLAELQNLLQSDVETPTLAQEVVSVSGHTTTVGRAPTAVFVITQEMIRRSGVTSIPEALRMAPGIQVARVNSSDWSITSRGFNNNIAGLLASNNKLLVLIDGRTVFSPFSNTTYWDVQDVLLADIDRIEVIRGPGATIWGANAVNGVINIITKRAADTQGALVQAGLGTEERGFTNARVGGQAGENVHYRVYGKWFDRDETFVATRPASDDWRQGRGGFRADWTPSRDDLVTVQGDFYGGTEGFFNAVSAPGFPDDQQVVGGNILGRWTRTFSEDNEISTQVYYDRADRDNQIGFFTQHYNTYDFEFRHHVRLNSYHNVVWGAGYRMVRDHLTPLTSPPGSVIAFTPPERSFDKVSGFLQDEMTLTDALFLTPGAKLSHNDFTAWEVQPSVRLLYCPAATWATWASVSRAVRTPSRLEHDATILAGTTPFLDFVPTFHSEEVLAYEWGYRAQPHEWFSWDLALFFNQYEELSSLSATPPGVLPVINTNGNRGEGYGVELASTIDLAPNWRLTGSYSFLQLQIHPDPSTINFLGSNGELIEGSSPHNQAFLMSSHNLTHELDLDFIGRYVDELPILRVPSYIELDARLAWRPRASTELALVGQNLLNSQHVEYLGTPSNQIQRGVYGMITQRW
jgi:iron complex outermembrane recepter protein